MQVAAQRTWTGQPEGETEIFGQRDNRVNVDLSLRATVRLQCNVIVPGKPKGSQFSAPAAWLEAQYSLDGGQTWWSLGVSVPIGSIGHKESYPLLRDSGAVPIPDGATAEVMTRIVGNAGDGAYSPVLGLIELSFQ